MLHTGKKPPFPDQETLRWWTRISLSTHPPTQDPEFRALSVEAWVEKVMPEVERKGIDNFGVTWDAVRRVKGAEWGEVFARVARAPYHFDGRWR